MVVIKCLSCGQSFDDYQGLSLHIAASKTGHRRGKRWAAKYISRHIINKHNNDIRGRTPLSAEDRANKQDTRRELSGEQRVADTVCPKCNKDGRVVLEAEYASSSQAWRIQGQLVKMCASCGR